MSHDTKIATCCYCDSRTVLKLSARNGHELACGSCGAPLHNMKAMKVAKKAPTSRKSPQQKHVSYAKSPKPVKRRKSRWKDRLEDVWDVIEDIFD